MSKITQRHQRGPTWNAPLSFEIHLPTESMAEMGEKERRPTWKVGFRHDLHHLTLEEVC
jgi:hypothetical protein